MAVAREERPVGAEHREVRARIASDRGIEALEFARVDRDLHHAGELAVRIERLRLAAKNGVVGGSVWMRGCSTSADEQADVLVHVRGEIVASRYDRSGAG